ncbi:MAG: ribosomal L7Ae/L30e/S12e/Gadd45 family protein [Clostridiales bacterium]|nr:ribosomal L7Ae/L30e/S12e/Gadd45 family protein [Clostridiales bacterium]
MGLNPKLFSLLGMCRKAGRLSCGHDAALGSIKSKKAKLCILTLDSSERLRREMEREITFHAFVPIHIINATIDEIGRATGLRSAVLTVNDEGFAKAMSVLLDKEEEVNQ